MHVGRHALSKWIRIVCACVLAVCGATGLFRSVRSGLAQERYFRFKYGHMIGTRWEVPPAVSTNVVVKYHTLPGLLPGILDSCEESHRLCPENYYFPAFAAQHALWVALTDTDPVAFRRHFGAAEHWSAIAMSLNPYDIENCHIHCRLLWEKGERDEAIAFWRDHVVARRFWNPDARSFLVDLCKRNGDYSVARREAAFLPSATATIRGLEKVQRRRAAALGAVSGNENP